MDPMTLKGTLNFKKLYLTKTQVNFLLDYYPLSNIAFEFIYHLKKLIKHLWINILYTLWSAHIYTKETFWHFDDFRSYGACNSSTICSKCVILANHTIFLIKTMSLNLWVILFIYLFKYCFYYHYGRTKSVCCISNGMSAVLW